MPLYVYRCPACETVIEEQRPIAAMDDRRPCPEGCTYEETGERVPTERIPALPAAVFPGAASWRSR